MNQSHKVEHSYTQRSQTYVKVDQCLVRHGHAQMVMTRKGNSTKSGVLKWLRLFSRQISTAFTLSCSPESFENWQKKDFSFDKWKLLLDDDADLALVKHVVEGSSLPLLVPVVHLPHTSRDQTQGQSNEDLLHHARALEGGMCNPATCHLLAC